MIISVVAQKGGVGKSSLARTIAVELTRAGYGVLLADVDANQSTTNRWAEKRRNVAKIQPLVETSVFSTTVLAVKACMDYDVGVIDGAPHATRGTLDAAMASDLVVIPTGSSLDDLEPAVFLAHELSEKVGDNTKIVFALYKTTSDAQERLGRETLEEYGYEVLPGGIQVKTGYIDAFDRGYCATETRYEHLNEKAMTMVQAIVNRLK